MRNLENGLLFEKSIEAAIQETKKFMYDSSYYYQKALEVSESVISYNSLRNASHKQLCTKKMKSSCLETAKMLMKVLDEKDEYTREHCQRVTQIALMIGQAMSLSKEEMMHLEFAGLLHDIGKIALPDEIINKEGKLTEQEYNIVKLHPAIGYQLLMDMTFLAVSREILLQHHERMDGKGYPLGLKGEQIDIKARILAVADAYDAMTSSRPYRRAGMTASEAVFELEIHKEAQFDREIVDIWIELLKSGVVA